MQEALARLTTLAVVCAEAPGWSMSDSDVVDALDAVHRLEQAVAAVKLHLVRQVDGRRIHTAQHHRTCASWVRDRLRVSTGTARRLVELAGAVDTRHDLDRAVIEGRVNVEQAVTIVDTLAAVPGDAGPDVTDKAQSLMIDWAADFDPHAMRALGSRILSHVDPDLADRIDAAALARAEARAYAGRTLTLSPVGDGRVRLSGYLDAEAAATVNAALDPLCAPRLSKVNSPATATQGAATPSAVTPSAVTPSAVAIGAAAPIAAPSDAAPTADTAPGQAARGACRTDADERTPGQRRADALVDVCRLMLNTGELPTNGGERSQINLTIDLDALSRQIGVGTLDTGERVTAAQARRLACDAHLLPAVLGGAGQVLDVGRSRRLITGVLRRALVLRDRGCAFPGCDRAPRWTDGHHLRHWADGGPTSLDNSVLLCRRHHRVIHHDDWQVRLGPDGLPEFLPPIHIDPHRRPRRNVFHLRR